MIHVPELITIIQKKNLECVCRTLQRNCYLCIAVMMMPNISKLYTLNTATLVKVLHS